VGKKQSEDVAIIKIHAALHISYQSGPAPRKKRNSLREYLLTFGGVGVGHRAMSIVWVLGFSLSAVVGLRRMNVVCFVPIAAVIAISTILIIRHPTLREVVLALSVPEIAYLAGVIAVAGAWYFLRQVLRIRGKLQLSGSLHALRTAISRELDAALEPPQEMPDKLARLAAQVRGA
jgi:hypothetical protein